MKGPLTQRFDDTVSGGLFPGAARFSGFLPLQILWILTKSPGLNLHFQPEIPSGCAAKKAADRLHEMERRDRRIARRFSIKNRRPSGFLRNVSRPQDFCAVKSDSRQAVSCAAIPSSSRPLGRRRPSSHSVVDESDGSSCCSRFEIPFSRWLTQFSTAAVSTRIGIGFRKQRVAPAWMYRLTISLVRKSETTKIPGAFLLSVNVCRSSVPCISGNIGSNSTKSASSAARRASETFLTQRTSFTELKQINSFASILPLRKSASNTKIEAFIFSNSLLSSFFESIICRRFDFISITHFS